MITGINHITLSVSDLDQAFVFYSQVLSCKPVARWRRGAYLLAGDLWLCLCLDRQARQGTLPEYTHIAFSVAEPDFQKIERQISDVATIWQQNSSEGRSLYFLDPDGHKLEIHVGDLQARIEAVQAQPYEGMEFFI
ncbi:MAG: Glutathione transferase FosA [Chroococcidiopsis sp. SAG 2025]|uniref:fosfomycin resistance glutathione transferase n=1 Tax=Chroococcidiopsis sp. SAG 2025 TaxID=171389 RepID=UPI002937464C|nr:fosfomycin resistance glutathione transferase [Chroococcidiopsis sp. SAG 2025]MDV2993979.1 Glutathione transferase FosA [Chroococcidiopsis sp. SAG 2025]